MTGNDHDAADATQEALVAIVRGLPRFDGRSSFSTWVYRVATNACLDEMRRRKRRPAPAADPADVGGALAAAGGAATRSPASTPSPDADVALRVDVDTALRQLPEDFRAAVVLRDLSGLDYAEIGEVLGIPQGTVKSRIARGRAMLADLLGGNPATTAERPTS